MKRARFRGQEMALISVERQCRGGVHRCAVVSALLCFIALIAQGCAKKPEGIPLAALRFDYQTWNCRELAQETDLLRDALAVASEQRSAETVAHLKAETEALHKASALKKCSA
jgi:hypothetical protein